MVEPLRHRQTKGAATDMFYLTPPRHISTLPKSEELRLSKCLPEYLGERTSLDEVDMSQTCQFRTHASQQRPSFDHTIGACEQAIWNSDAEGAT